MPDKTGNPIPPDAEKTPPDVVPEGAEWEPAGGIVKKPPAPESADESPSE